MATKKAPKRTRSLAAKPADNGDRQKRSRTARSGTTPSDIDPVVNLAARGNDVLEALGERYVLDRFPIYCSPDPFFAAARLERFTRGVFPRILLDAAALDYSTFSAEVALADLAFLTQLISDNPTGFEGLLANLDDPSRFTECAQNLGLSEEASLAAGGGLIQLLIVAAAAVVLVGAQTGCSAAPPAGARPTSCLVQSTIPGVGKCIRPTGHPLSNRSPHQDFVGQKFLK